MHARQYFCALSLLPAALIAACSADVTTGQWAEAVGPAAGRATDATTHEAATGNFGISTTAVFVVNPQINEGSTTTASVGSIRGGVPITLAGGSAVTANANGFSAAFSEFGGADIKGNGVTLIRNVFAADAATVPSSNAILVDNLGIP